MSLISTKQTIASYLKQVNTQNIMGEHPRWWDHKSSLATCIWIQYCLTDHLPWKTILCQKKGCLWTQILIFLGFKIHENIWLTQYLIMKSRMFWIFFDFLSHLRPARYKYNDRYSIASAKLSLQNKKTELWQINPYFSD